jgi:hypothetical protein
MLIFLNKVVNETTHTTIHKLKFELKATFFEITTRPKIYNRFARAKTKKNRYNKLLLNKQIKHTYIFTRIIFLAHDTNRNKTKKKKQ